MARRSDVAPAWCDLHGTCIGKRNGVRSARQRCKGRFVGGAYSGSRDPSAMARARAARVSVELQRAPATGGPQRSNIVRIVKRRVHLALERKRPVKPTEVFKVFKVR